MKLQEFIDESVTQLLSDIDTYLNEDEIDYTDELIRNDLEEIRLMRLLSFKKDYEDEVIIDEKKRAKILEICSRVNDSELNEEVNNLL